MNIRKAIPKLIGKIGAFLSPFNHAEDSVERSSQIVRHMRQKFTFRQICAVCFIRRLFQRSIQLLLLKCPDTHVDRRNEAKYDYCGNKNADNRHKNNALHGCAQKIFSSALHLLGRNYQQNNPVGRYDRSH